MFSLVAKMQKAQREAYSYQQVRWGAPPLKQTTKHTLNHEPEFLGKVMPLEKPVKKIISLGVSSVEERDEQLEAYLAPDPAELSLVPKPIQAGEDEPEGEESPGEEEMSEKADDEVDVEC